MSRLEMRWAKIQKGVILGMEGVLAKQEIMVIQARATVKALEGMHEVMKPGEGEAEDVFNARKDKMLSAVEQTKADLELKVQILDHIIAEYEDFLNNTADSLDTSILEESNGKETGANGCCHCSHSERED